MSRPSKCRRICKKPSYNSFVPCGVDLSEQQIILSFDEYEVIRLIDYEKNTHEQCAKQMDISRTTVTEIYERARFKISDSIINGKKLVISGGNYRFCDGTSEYCRIRRQCHINEKGVKKMKIAVTYENGNIFQHFGHTENFKIYEVSDGKVINSEVVSTMGNGHSALVGFLSERDVNVLICGGIGGGAKNALSEAGIELYGGVSGNADEALNAFISGKLSYNPDVLCSHHHDHDNCENHTCH